MRVIEAVAARLDQSVKMAANLGIELPSADLASENQIRNAIWRSIFCSHGHEWANGAFTAELLAAMATEP